jgi:hypothetical protein
VPYITHKSIFKSFYATRRICTLCIKGARDIVSTEKTRIIAHHSAYGDLDYIFGKRRGKGEKVQKKFMDIQGHSTR